MIARAPKAVAAIKPPNSSGASVARFRSVITPFRRWLAFGVPASCKPVERRRQVIQRRIFGPCYGQRRKQLFLAGVDLRFPFRMLGGKLPSGQPSTRPNQRRYHQTPIGLLPRPINPTTRAINLTANTFHCPPANALFVGNQNVAGGSTDNFYQCVRLCASPTAPIWQSNAPPEITTLSGRPRRCAHSGRKSAPEYRQSRCQ